MSKTLNVFPENSLTALVIHLARANQIRTSITDLRQASLMNTFSNVYKKNYLRPNSFKHISQPFSSMYRKINSLYNILIRFHEEWSRGLDNFVVKAVMTNLCKFSAAY